MSRTQQALYVVAVVTMAATLACTAGRRERLLHFFFEVPPADATAQAADPAGTDGEPPVMTVAQPATRSVHPPVAERNCVACHDAGQTMHVRTDYLDDCKSCHGRFFTEEVRHEPVQKQQCDKCHVPHRSDEPFLLYRQLFDVCMRCHDEPEELSQEHHSREDVVKCTMCHDPHFGEGQFMLKTGWPVPPESVP